MRLLFFVITVTYFFMASSLWADTIFLQNNPQGNAGEVMEEYPDAIVIKFPKTEIKRIEAGEQPPAGSSLQKVIWIEDGDTITLRLPKQSVQVSGAGEMLQGGGSGTGAVNTGLVSSFQEIARKATDRVIQGKVFYKGNPLENCKVKILKATDSSKDQILDMFSDSKGKEEDKFYEAVTDANGIYTFTNIPYGEYILYWKPAASMNWIRKLSENPDITLMPGRPVVNVRDIETNVKTAN